MSSPRSTASEPPDRSSSFIEQVNAMFDKPRDPARIEPILNMLKAYWNAHPDLRLGQIVCSLAGGTDPFYVEDELVDGMLRTLLKEGP